MLDCKKIETDLFEYLDKQCDPNFAKEFEEHLNLCRQCFDRVDFERIMREYMKKKTNHMCPEKVKKRIQNLIDQF